MYHLFTLSKSLWRNDVAHKPIKCSLPKQRLVIYCPILANYKHSPATVPGRCNSHLQDHNNVQNEVTGLDVWGKGMCACPYEQMNMYMCACPYISMWKPEVNVQMHSSITTHFMFWDEVSHQTRRSSTQRIVSDILTNKGLYIPWYI